MSFENKWKNYQRIVESTGKGHLAPNEFQQKMKTRRSRNDVYTKGGNVKSFGKSNTYFENLDEAEQEVLDSFGLQDALNTGAFEARLQTITGRSILISIFTYLSTSQRLTLMQT